MTVTLGGGAAAEQIMRGDRMADIHLAARWDGASSCELAILSGRTEYSIQRQDLPPARWLTLEPGQEAVLVGTADDRGRCISISFDT